MLRSAPPGQDRGVSSRPATISFPRQQARTRRFSLGVPRNFVVSLDGRRILFLRSRTGMDPLTCLYEWDVDSGGERLVVDPAAVLGETERAHLPPEERARRERQRETSAGVVRFTASRDLSVATFDLAGRLFVVDVASGSVNEIGARGPVVDPRIDPTGARVAYISNGALRVVATPSAAEGGDMPLADSVLAEPEHPDITYGLAEFVAAEEMGRSDGHWWAPDGRRLLVARVDVSRVGRRYIADPAHPESVPVEVAYPQAGGLNADVSLALIGLDGAKTAVEWDRAGFEYLVSVDWTSHGLLIVVQSRDQRLMRILEVDLPSGHTSVVREDSDVDWVDIVEGVPCRLEDGTLVWTEDRDGAKQLVVGVQAVTGPGRQVRSVLGIDGDAVLFRASASGDASVIDVFRWSRQGGVVTIGPTGGVASGAGAGGTAVIVASTLDRLGREVVVLNEDLNNEAGRIDTVDAEPVVSPVVHLRSYTARNLKTAVLFPTGHETGSGTLPVLLSPYGGPHGQMVVASAYAFLEAQWFADQGFAVVVIDGRGTPGRGPSSDRAVRGDLATPALDDQVAALQAAADEWPDLDLGRVAIRGWSFGGYLAGLGVLRRPDIFHAAVSGAPVTEMRLYDTHYTERYLGHPGEEPENYDRTSLLGDAAGLERPLLLIHGLVDDNVAVANTLQLSAALLAGGRPHSVLPLSGVTHMTPQEVVAENLLLLQLQFLKASLGLTGPPGKQA
jgi:dipeptidyl-peptidase-4